MKQYLIILNRQNENGEAKVYLHKEDYVNGKRKQKRIPTEVWVKPNNWSKAKRQVKKGDPEQEEKNQLLSLFLEAQRLSNPFVTPNKGTPNTGKKNLLHYLDEYIQFRIARGDKRGSYKEFITVKNRLLKFSSVMGITLHFEDLNLTFSDKLITWMGNEEYDPNTIKKTFVTLSTFINHYYKRKNELDIKLSDIFKSKDFGDIKTHASPPVILDPSEFLQLSYDASTEWERELTEKEVLVKDMMLLQCSTGLRYSDLFRITPEKIKNYVIHIEPVKTENTKKDNLCKIPLNMYSSSILEKYEFDTTRIKLSNQHYNKMIKQVAEILKIDSVVIKKEYNGLGDPIEKKFKKYEILTSHNFRDHFISYCIKVGIDIPTIMKYTNQSSWEVMQRYVKLSDDHLIESMDKFNLEATTLEKKPKHINKDGKGDKKLYGDQATKAWENQLKKKGLIK